MKRTLLHYPALACLALAGFLAAMVLTTPQATAQAPNHQMSDQRLDFNISSLNGLPLHGQARGAADLNYTAAVSVTTQGGRSILHRLFVDHNRHIYFGYDLEAYQVQGQDQVHLHFGPLSHLESFPGVALGDLTPRRLMVPADQTVAINTPAEVPLEVGEKGTQVLRDKLTFGPRN